MKKSKISRVVITAIAASALCLVAQTRAQVGSAGSTYTSDNPHLRPAAPSSHNKAKALSEKDKNFILKAASGGQQEVENGKMAEKKAQGSPAKMVAERMVTDHTRANKELVALAKQKGLGVTTDNIRAQNMSGSNFDKQYLSMLEMDHKKDIADFEKEAKSGDDPEVKAWA